MKALFECSVVLSANDKIVLGSNDSLFRQWSWIAFIPLSSVSNLKKARKQAPFLRKRHGNRKRMRDIEEKGNREMGCRQ